MVWGMNLPEGFGEFWPLGDFEHDPLNKDSGWYKRLNVHYFQQPLEEQIRLGAGNKMVGNYGFYVVGKFRAETGTCIGNKPPLTPVEPHEPPMSFDTEKIYDTLGSLIMLNDGILAVDEALKAIIDRLEPDVHQFYPIEVKMPKGKVYSGSYYTFVVGQYFNAWSREDSDTKSFNEFSPGFFKVFPSNGLGVRKAVFGNAHLWRDRSFKEDLTCLSDELKTEIDKAGLRIPKHYKMLEV